jgi:hypothetical protein
MQTKHTTENTETSAVLDARKYESLKHSICNSATTSRNLVRIIHILDDVDVVRALHILDAAKNLFKIKFEEVVRENS